MWKQACNIIKCSDLSKPRPQLGIDESLYQLSQGQSKFSLKKSGAVKTHTCPDFMSVVETTLADVTLSLVVGSHLCYKFKACYNILLKHA